MQQAKKYAKKENDGGAPDTYRDKDFIPGAKDGDDQSSVYMSQDDKTSIKGGDKSKHGFSEKQNDKSSSKKTNTVIQQINAFSLTPMNEPIAEQTLEDHKYLLIEVQNRAAIAYFAAANRNLSLYLALKKYCSTFENDNEEMPSPREKMQHQRALKNFKTKIDNFNKYSRLNLISHMRNLSGMQSGNISLKFQTLVFLEQCFERMILKYDFLSVIMYPELKSRREFVHDAWLIAKYTENFELKMAISKDQYFYITREDIFQLIKTQDDEMIEHMLKIKTNLQIHEDISYKLVSIKQAQVDQNQQTPVQLVDFISVMVISKRIDNFAIDSQVLINHERVVQFLERHSQFMNLEEIIKVFIMYGKFRLTIKYINEESVKFNIEYFTMALVYNSFDIAFYLFANFEDAIVYDFQKSIEALVASYTRSNKFLKAKLHMTKLLLPIFTFNGANSFLKEITNRINDASLENNLFSHSSNPLLCMCLLYEFLLMLKNKFFSLNNNCRQLNEKLLKIMILYIECIDDENFLTALMKEKDFMGRDSLKISVNLELLDVIQHPKVEAIILRIWNSDYESNGTIMEMSTAYQIIMQPSDINIDVEFNNRFLKSRDISQSSQSEWIFEIFQNSMFTRIKAIGLIYVLFTVISVIYYVLAVMILNEQMPRLMERSEIQAELSYFDVGVGPMSQSAMLKEKELQLKKLDQDLITTLKRLYSIFLGIQTLSYLNLMFFIQQVISFIFIKKMGRDIKIGSPSQIIDAALFVSSVVLVLFIQNNLQDGMQARSDLTQEEYNIIMISNFQDNISFKFQYLFSIQISCLLSRIALIIQFNSTIGPLLKIVQKMASDFMNFLIIYIVLLTMFVCLGNLNFLFYCEDLQTPFDSFITMVDGSMGNYDFGIFEEIDDVIIRNAGKAYLMLSIVIFTILILNLIIAILSNTYNIFDPKSNGLYLSKILATRDELQHDENYSAFIAAMSPLNVIILPFVPIFIFFKPNPNVNTIILKSQYFLLLMILFFFFNIISILLLPFAYLKSLIYKLKQVFKPQSTPVDILKSTAHFLLFLFFGIPVMIFTQISDCYYFLKNSFRTKLKKIVIEREPSMITMDSIKRIIFLCGKHNANRIKGIYTIDYVKKLREDLGINELLQFLIYGQYFGKSKHSDDFDQNPGNQTQRSVAINPKAPPQRMQTMMMKERRRKERAKSDTRANLNRALLKLKQFNEIKRIASNLSFYNKGNSLIVSEIVLDVINDMRRERKILMVLKDSASVLEYVQSDLLQYVMQYEEYLQENANNKTKNDADNIEVLNAGMRQNEEGTSDCKIIPSHIQNMIQKKDIYKHEMVQKLSLVKVCYIFKMIEQLDKTRATCVDPSRFREKKDQLELKDRELNELGEDAQDLQEFKRHYRINFGQEDDTLHAHSSNNSDTGSAGSKNKKDDKSEMDFNDQDPIIGHMSQSYQNIRVEIDKCGKVIKDQKKIIDIIKDKMSNQFFQPNQGPNDNKGMSIMKGLFQKMIHDQQKMQIPQKTEVQSPAKQIKGSLEVLMRRASERKMAPQDAKGSPQSKQKQAPNQAGQGSLQNLLQFVQSQTSQQ